MVFSMEKAQKQQRTGCEVYNKVDIFFRNCYFWVDFFFSEQPPQGRFGVGVERGVRARLGIGLGLGFMAFYPTSLLIMLENHTPYD